MRIFSKKANPIHQSTLAARAGWDHVVKDETSHSLVLDFFIHRFFRRIGSSGKYGLHDSREKKDS